MLVFDPTKRLSMKGAIESAYLAGLHQARSLPPTTEVPFSFAFENDQLSQEELRDVIWEEMRHFPPEVEPRRPLTENAPAPAPPRK